MGRDCEQLRALCSHSGVSRGQSAPKRVIEKKFRKEIQDELTKKLVSKSYHEAIAEKQLRVVSLTNLEDVEFGDDRSMRFRATVVTAPEFDLPEYKNIPVQLPAATVPEAEVDAALERLRDQAADFTDVADRELAMEDFAVHRFRRVDRWGTDQRDRAGGEQEPAWREEVLAAIWRRRIFCPGSASKSSGMKPGDTRSVQVEFPAEFPVTELAGKKADYAVTLNEIKQKVLPGTR